jgi:hypothetical protein
MTSKLIEVLVIVSHKISFVKATIVTTKSPNELIVTTTKEPKLIKGGVELAIVPCTLFLPLQFMEMPIVVVNT